MRNQEPGRAGGRDDVLAHVASNLRRLRRQAGLSQEALARASGLSRRMIVNLEAGDTNISLSSLDRLAEALGATFVQMVSAPHAEDRRIEALAWRGAGASRAMLLGSVPATQDAQLWTWALDAGDRYQAEPDPEGWHEMVLVYRGTLVIELEEGPITIGAGDFVIYTSAQSYAYTNPTDAPVSFVRIVVR